MVISMQPKVWQQKRWGREKEKTIRQLAPILYIYIYIYTHTQVELATLVEDDSKAPFSIATTPRCRGGRFSFPWIASLYPSSLPYNAVLSKAALSTIFWVFHMTWPGIEHRFPVPLANTLLIRPMDIDMMVRVFANAPGDLGSIPGRVIPKTQKMVLDASLLNTQHYKVRFKGKVEQSREWSSSLPYTSV